MRHAEIDQTQAALARAKAADARRTVRFHDGRVVADEITTPAGHAAG